MARRPPVRLPPPPASPLPVLPRRPPVAVTLRWALPPDSSPRAAEHAADLAVMRGAVTWWDWRGEVLVAACVRLREALALLSPTLGAPCADGAA